MLQTASFISIRFRVFLTSRTLNSSLGWEGICSFLHWNWP